MLKKILTAAALATLLWSPAGAQQIDGAGATFPYPLYAKWAEAFNGQTGIKVNYQSIGSGGGIKQIKSKTVDFGATDMPLPVDELKESGLVQFPMVMGGVVPVVNVRGIEPDQLRLTGTVLADIFLAKIAKWNDKAIADLNPGLALPSQAIAVVHRSDGSGTTFIFAEYLSKVSPEWKEKVGASTSVKWPTGLGGKGNEGVAATTQRTNGAIGYVEYAYAKQNKMAHALMGNREGEFVAPNSESFQSAAAFAEWEKAPGFNLLLTDQPGKKSWPITGATFILMHVKAEKADSSKRALQFFEWSYKNGGAMADNLDYVPMPPKVVQMVQQVWRTVTGPDGKPVYTGAAGM
jgi:phosphate transport system substrate-binding protein